MEVWILYFKRLLLIEIQQGNLLFCYFPVHINNGNKFGLIIYHGCEIIKAKYFW